jgi:hypothetical protein
MTMTWRESEPVTNRATGLAGAAGAAEGLGCVWGVALGLALGSEIWDMNNSKMKGKQPFCGLESKGKVQIDTVPQMHVSLQKKNGGLSA